MTNKRHLPHFGLIASAGLIPNIRRYRRFGVNNDIDTATTPEELWDEVGGPFTFPTVADTVEVSSSSANDTAAGTGTRVLKITGLNANYEEIEENIIMNGTTAVTSSNEYLILHSCFGISAGSSELNEGLITISHTTSGDDLARISPLLGRTQQLFGIIPVDAEWFVDTVRFNVQNKSSSASAVIRLQVQPFGTNHWQTLNTYELSSGSSGLVSKSGHDEYVVVPSKAKYRVRIVSVTANNTELSGSIGGYLINKGFSY